MRELKFRVWEDGKIIGYEFIDHLSFGRWSHVRVDDISPDGSPWVHSGFVNGGIITRQEREQFIGRLDKNGTEIYEGDILRFFIRFPSSQPETTATNTVIVSFEHGCVGFVPTHPDLVHPDDVDWRPFYKHEDRECWSEEYFTVVGNIHDNPAQEGENNETKR